jgi:hypothetical protein
MGIPLWVMIWWCLVGREHNSCGRSRECASPTEERGGLDATRGGLTRIDRPPYLTMCSCHACDDRNGSCNACV